METDDLEYLHVAFKGRFHHDKERYLYAPARAGLGWHVYTPLEWAPAHFVWVNRGFVPDERKDPATRREGQLTGEVEITGLVRVRQAKGAFTPTNDVAAQPVVLAGRGGHARLGLRRDGNECLPVHGRCRRRGRSPREACRAAASPGSTCPTAISNTR